MNPKSPEDRQLRLVALLLTVCMLATLLTSCGLFAKKAEVIQSEVTTEEPVVESTPTPMPEATPTPEVTPTPTPTPEVTPIPTPTPAKKQTISNFSGQKVTVVPSTTVTVLPTPDKNSAGSQSGGGSSIAPTKPKPTATPTPTKPPKPTETEEPDSDLPEGFDSEVSIGEDIDAPEENFEAKGANPTFASKEDEIANLAELNDGIVPYTKTDDNGVPTYIDGTFSDKNVSSAADAIAALNDIHHIMGFENAEQEFEEVYSESMDFGSPTNFYRLQQTYHGVPVYGYQLIVSADDSGVVQSMNGHYMSGIDVNVTPTITMEEAKEIASDKSSVRSDGLCVYYSESNNTYLVWIIVSESTTYFINADSGKIVSTVSNLRDIDSEMGSGVDMTSTVREFPVYKNHQNKYLMYDDIRKILSYNANHTSSQLIVKSDTNSSDKWSVFPEAISAYYNLAYAYDYYANILGRSGADGNGKPIEITTNYRTEDAVPYDNAYCSSYYPSKTVIRIGDARNFAQCLDVLAHEFTHSINKARWGANYLNASGAIDEAYADIMGELIQNERLEEMGEVLNGGAIRSFSNPEAHGDPSSVDKQLPFCNKEGKHDDHHCDNGNLHSNSGIINHAAYLMDQRWPTSNHSRELATLYYYSMNYLSPKSTFMDCRYALLAASKSMRLSDEKRDVIATALADVGIAPEDEEAWASMHHIIGVVKDATTQSPVIDAEVIAVATEGVGGGIGYTDGNGNYDVKIPRAIYRVTVHADGYKLYQIENVDLSHWFTLNHYMDTVYLTPRTTTDDKETVFASGKVTNALSGQSLEGVTVKFRTGSNNQSGNYVQTINGLDVELTTDSSGQYYTAALPTGNYTMEASIDGFVTGYKNIISGRSEVCNNQNISLTPELQSGTLRVVLEWGKDPADMDSHVVGTLAYGGTFHVYYSHKSEYDGTTEVCNLDVDDTDSYGPETITLTPTTKEPYYYYIYKYSGSGTTASSQSKVTIYQGNNVVAIFNVPTDQGNGDYWNVFAIVDGEIIVRNTITDSAEISYAGDRNSRISLASFFDDIEEETEVEKTDIEDSIYEPAAASEESAE